MKREVEQVRMSRMGFAAMGLVVGLTLGIIGAGTYLRLWPALVDRSRPAVPPPPLPPGCPFGSYPYWVTDGDRCVFVGLSGVDPCVPGTILTVSGTMCRLGEITSVVADMETNMVVDGFDSLSPDPATQCRRIIRDGESKIVGTYLADCSNGDLTIMGFDPAR